jgi:energy-coupling factor transporter ATP-binding protein EcfA2
MLTPMLLMSNASPYYKMAITLAMFFAEMVFTWIRKHATPYVMRAKSNLSMKVLLRVLVKPDGSIMIGTIPMEFHGFMDYLNDLIAARSSIDISNLEIVKDSDIASLGIIYISKNHNTMTHINDKIAFIVSKTTNQPSTSNSNAFSSISTSIEIKVISKRNKIEDLNEFREELIKMYNKKFDIDTNKYLYIKRVTGIACNKYIETNDAKFTATKTFDNMFFEGKKQMLSILDNFKQGKDTSRRLGLPHTLGFLLHGQPGCGKTSVIKCIARYMKRDIMIVDTALIKTRDNLETVFMHKRQSTIYVFEEIDCGSWKDIIMDRQLKKQLASVGHQNVHETSNAELMKMIVDTMGKNEESKQENSADKKKTTITLSDILEILDGILDMDGRVIIFTTNHKDILDPALLRPGRIDHVIEFTKMSKRCIQEMYRQWFDEDIPQDVYDDMCDGVFSQAEIGKIFKTFDKPKRLEALRLGKY